ncbi:MAG TPA: OmpA family protein [Ferruginibacter sp.]|nr:OmpA family protein [Ferruginibacter sp.]HRE65014.1 OmpA family protein [Ferruginibacter sp.]
MKKIFLLFVCCSVIIIAVNAQTNSEVQNATIPKDAPIDVSVMDFKNNQLSHEIIVFRSQANGRDYQGISGVDGKFSTRLPAGDKYDIFILGFKDSTSYNVLDIPAPQGNAYYKNPFKVDIQFQPSKTFILENVNYETGKADLDDESFPVLDELVAYLNRKADERIEIGGHTDNVGTPANNLKLSTERAVTVMQYLISKGINPERLQAKGYGLTMPIESNKTEEGRAINRRTEVKILD